MAFPVTEQSTSFRPSSYCIEAQDLGLVSRINKLHTDSQAVTPPYHFIVTHAETHKKKSTEQGK